MSFARKCKKQLLDTGLDSVDAVTKSNDDNIEKQEPVEEKLFNQKKEIKIRQTDQNKKMVHYKYIKIIRRLNYITICNKKMGRSK